MEVSVSKSPPRNKIQPEIDTREGPIEWDNIAIAMTHDLKTAVIVAARRERLTVSEWGRKTLIAALEDL